MPSSFPALVPSRRRGTQHLLRLKLRVAKCERDDARGLETHSGPHTGLLMTSDVAAAHPLSPGSGEGQRIEGTRMHGEGRERPSHQPRSLPDPWLMIDGSWRSCGARVDPIVCELGPDWLELDVWLARSPPRDAARNFSIEKTVPRDSM